MASAPLTLYGRAWCHLCDDMRAALEPIAGRVRRAHRMVDIDVDADPVLGARYDEHVRFWCSMASSCATTIWTNRGCARR